MTKLFDELFDWLIITFLMCCFNLIWNYLIAIVTWYIVLTCIYKLCDIWNEMARLIFWFELLEINYCRMLCLCSVCVDFFTLNESFIIIVVKFKGVNYWCILVWCMELPFTRDTIYQVNTLVRMGWIILFVYCVIYNLGLRWLKLC